MLFYYVLKSFGIIVCVEECFEDIKPVRVWGDNHCGHIGFRNPFAGSFSDDSAMNVLVRD